MQPRLKVQHFRTAADTMDIRVKQTNIHVTFVAEELQFSPGSTYSGPESECQIQR